MKNNASSSTRNPLRWLFPVALLAVGLATTLSYSTAADSSSVMPTDVVVIKPVPTDWEVAPLLVTPTEAALPGASLPLENMPLSNGN
jgi:hypothetical protein